MRILSPAFHTSYQYNLAAAMPEHEWTFFLGEWSRNRPCPPNVRHKEEGKKSTYDVALVHSPQQYYGIKSDIEASGAALPIIFVCHVGLVPTYESHGISGRTYEKFLKDIEDCVIVCVSHFMIPQWRFRSNRLLTVVPHYVPIDIIGQPVWGGGARYYVNVCNNFYQPNRGVGADFWSRLTIERKLYGDHNGPTGSGKLVTVDDFRAAMADVSGFLWCADNVAMSFAPLEAATLGVPLIAARKADWPTTLVHRETGMLYDYGNIEECEMMCREVADDLDLARRLSTEGSKSIKALFNEAAFRRGWLAALDAAIS